MRYVWTPARGLEAETNLSPEHLDALNQMCAEDFIDGFPSKAAVNLADFIGVGELEKEIAA